MLRLTSFALLLLVPSVAWADDPPPEPPRAAPPAYGEETTAPREAPPEYVAEPLPKPPAFAHRGFQLAFRTGVAVPIGSAKDPDPDDGATPGAGSSLGDLVGPQLPLAIDIGAKPNRYVFIGAYASLALGLAAGDLSDACDRLQRDCRATNVPIGLQVHYAIVPDGWVNPWVGYGLGFSWLSVGDDGQRTTLRGFDFGHFLAGADIRVSRTIGVGPFADFTVGKYSSRALESGGAEVDRDIDGRAFHYWLTIGPRIVLFP